MSKELLELSELYLQIAEEEDLKKSTNKGVTELQTAIDKENSEEKKKEGIKIKVKGGGYKILYPGHPNYQAAKDGTFTGVLGSEEGRTEITKNNETGQLEGQSKINSSDDGTGDDGASVANDKDTERKNRIKELETKLTNKENERKEKINNIGNNQNNQNNQNNIEYIKEFFSVFYR